MRMYSYKSHAPQIASTHTTLDRSAQGPVASPPDRGGIQRVHGLTEFRIRRSRWRRSPAACSLPPGCRLRVRRHNIYPLP